MVMEYIVMIRKNPIICKIIREKRRGDSIFRECMDCLSPDTQACPYCGCKGKCRIHAYYGRTLIDIIGGKQVKSSLCVLRLICRHCKHLEVDAGPALLFNTMGGVFNTMAGGRIWGTIFFLFMTFAAFSTVLAVCENILACVRELTGWDRKRGCVVTGIVLFLGALTTALGYSVFSGFHPFTPESVWLDFWDFTVSTNLLPLGALAMTLFCVSDRFGWGWENFKAEANAGEGMKVKNWMKPIFRYFVPIVIIGLYVYGLFCFQWR